MKSSEATGILGEIASQQWGLVTSAQARSSGVDLPSLRRLEKQGNLIRVRHGVYASSAVTMSAELELKAEWLALKPHLMAAERMSTPSLAEEAVISHTTAAEFWEIGDLWPDGAHFTVQRRRQSRQAGVQFHRSDLTLSEWIIHPAAGLPITTVARTIFDLAQSGYEPEHLLSLVADAGSKSLLDEQELLGYFAGREDAFGLKRGDQSGLNELLSKYSLEAKTIRQTRLLIDEALRPIQEQMSQLMNSIMATPSWPQDVSSQFNHHLVQKTSFLNNSGIARTTFHSPGLRPSSQLTVPPQRLRENPDTHNATDPQNPEDTRSGN